MAGPELEDPGEMESDVDGGEQPEFSMDEPEDDFEVGEVDLGTDDDEIVAGFDGVEEDKGGEEEEEESKSVGSGSGGAPDVEEAIENGLAEMSVVGLRGQQRRVMRSEMQAIASKFKIGYFGREVGEKYLQRDLDDIPPEYGLAAALIAFAAITIYKRPDGEEKIQEAIQTIRSQFSGEESSVEQETETETEETTDNE